MEIIQTHTVIYSFMVYLLCFTFNIIITFVFRFIYHNLSCKYFISYFIAQVVLFKFLLGAIITVAFFFILEAFFQDSICQTCGISGWTGLLIYWVFVFFFVMLFKFETVLHQSFKNKSLISIWDCQMCICQRSILSCSPPHILKLNKMERQKTQFTILNIIRKISGFCLFNESLNSPKISARKQSGDVILDICF